MNFVFACSLFSRRFLKGSLIKGEFQIFFYFRALKVVVGVAGLPIFQQSVDAGLYECLLKEQKRQEARSVQDVIRQVLREAKAEAEKQLVLS